MARLGTWTVTHLREVLVAWALVILAFGFFAPRVQSALAGADHPRGHQLEQRLHAWGRAIWRHPLPAALAALVVLGLAAAPVLGLRTSMPSISIVPSSANARVGYTQVTQAFGPGAPGTLQVVVPVSAQPSALAVLDHAPGVAVVVPGPKANGWTLDQVVPTTGPSTAATGATH
jgi:putative drug exporter of the RND superfamily